MPNADKQEIEVNYITAPSLKDDPIYIFNAGGDASPTLNISVDGKDISLDDLNSPDGDIEAKFTFPGSTVADTYKLHAGD